MKNGTYRKNISFKGGGREIMKKISEMVGDMHNFSEQIRMIIEFAYIVFVKFGRQDLKTLAKKIDKLEVEGQEHVFVGGFGIYFVSGELLIIDNEGRRGSVIVEAKRSVGQNNVSKISIFPPTKTGPDFYSKMHTVVIEILEKTSRVSK